VLLFQSSVWTWGFQGGERRGGSKRSAELWSVLIIISVAWLLVCTTVSLKVFTFPPSCCVCVFFFCVSGSHFGSSVVLREEEEEESENIYWCYEREL
jgi:hypothetical protein